MLAGLKNNQNVIFDETQWIKFLNKQSEIFNIIYSNSLGWQPLQENGYQINFVFIGDSRIIQIKQESGNEIFIAADSLNELFNFAGIIKYRFDMLFAQDFSK